MSCHGPSGEGNLFAHFPKVSGQHSDYTKAQLKLYQSGTRQSDPNKIMRMIAGRMTDSEIEAVSSYLEGLYDNRENTKP